MDLATIDFETLEKELYNWFVAKSEESFIPCSNLPDRGYNDARILYSTKNKREYRKIFHKYGIFGPDNRLKTVRLLDEFEILSASYSCYTYDIMYKFWSRYA